MRAVVVGPLADYSVADVARGWTTGLRSIGVQTAYFDLGTQLEWFLAAESAGDRMPPERARQAVTLNLLAECYRLDPDVVIIITGNDVAPEFIAELRCRTVLVLTEHPYEAEGQLIAASQMRPDMILVNDPAGAGIYEQVAPTFYIPHAYDPAVHYPGDGDHKWDACFIGTGFQNRVEWLERVDWSGIDLALGGWWARAEGTPLEPFLLHDDPTECVDNVITAGIYRASRTGFNIYRVDSHGEHSTADGDAIGPRELELAVCGTWFARDSRPESDELFPMLPTFGSPEELGDVIRWALAHPVERQQAADAARAAIEDRTFANNATRVLSRLGL
jgi:hypothetical protein